MANSDYLIEGNDEHGLEPLPTGGGMLVFHYYYNTVLYHLL